MSIIDVHDKLYSDGYIVDPDIMLATFEENKDVIESADLSTTEEIFAKTRLVSDYACHLSGKSHFSKALPYLNTSIVLWELYENEWDRPLKNIQVYEQLQFRLGVALSHLKKLKEAQKKFEWLVANYPENDLYREWLAATKKRRINNIAAAAGIIGVASFLPTLFIPNTPMADVGRGVFKVCAIVYVLTVVFTYFVYSPSKK